VDPGLAVGCSDDLDLVLGIVAAWQRAPNPARWARSWWVDEQVLFAALDRARESLEGLSPKMKHEATRQLELALIPRARAVLSRALASLTYRPRLEEGTWEHELDPSSGAVGAGENQLTSVTGRVVALDRFRPTDPPNARPVIQGLISVTPWARRRSTDDREPDAFELLLRVAENRRGSDGNLMEHLARRRELFPVGSVVRVNRAGDSSQVAVLYDAPDPGKDLPDLDEPQYDDDTASVPVASGRAARRRGLRSVEQEARLFDRGGPRPEATEEPPEELATSLGDVRTMETNGPAASPTKDEVVHEGGARPPVAATPQDHVASVSWTEGPRENTTEVGCVFGYEVRDGDVALLLEPHAETARSLSPPNLHFGQSVAVRLGSVVDDHRSKYRVLRLEDPPGEVLLSDMAGGLDKYNRGWILEFKDEGPLRGIVVPGYGSKDPVSISLVPSLAQQLGRVKSLSGMKTGDRWYRATIVEIAERPGQPSDTPSDEEADGGASGRRLQARLAVGMPDGVDRKPFTFVVDMTKLGQTPDLKEGDEVEILVVGRRGRLTLPDEDVERLIRTLGAELATSEDGKSISGTGVAPLSLGAAKALSKLRGGDPRWERAVWRFWQDCQYLMVITTRRAAHRQDLVISPGAAKAVQRSGTRGRIAEKYGVTIHVDEETGAVAASGDLQAVTAAVEELRQMSAAQTVFLTLPSSRAQLLLRKASFDSDQKHIDRLRGLSDVILCQVDTASGILTITGRTNEAIVKAVEMAKAVVVGAEGAVILSQADYVGLVVGRLHVKLNAILRWSGCTDAEPPRKGTDSPIFMVWGPTEAALESFCAHVRSIDPYVSLTITSEFYSLQIRDSATGRDWIPPAAPPPPPPPPSPAAPVVRPSPRQVAPPPPRPPRRHTVTTEGDSVDDAIAVGLRQLRATDDEVTVEVLQAARYSLILGRVKQRAIVRLTTK
jgi:hypothetical protein